MTDNGTIFVEIDQLIIGAKGFFTRPLDEGTVQRYRSIIAQLPAVEGWIDPETGDIHLLDGRHRVEAHRQEGVTGIKLELFNSSCEDAEVRSRTANMAHPLQLTSELWRQAVTDVVRRRYTRSNNWIAEEANCSPTTVKNIRIELEQAGEIPYLDRLERKSGGTAPREFSRDGKDAEGVGQRDEAGQEVTAEVGDLPLDEDDLLDREEEGEKELHGSGWDNEKALNGQPSNSVQDGPRRNNHSEARLFDEMLDTPVRSNDSKGPKQQTLKFAPSGDDILPIEVIIYTNGIPQSIPVTLMFAKGAIAGIPETSLEDYQQAALVVDVEVGRQRGLIL